MNRGLGGRRALRVGILFGLIAGIADAIAVLIENPNSFSGWRSPVAFVSASVALHLVLGAALGGILALTGIARRISPAVLLAIGLGAFLFLWIAIRVHVQWFFGEPLTSTKSLPAYSAAFVGSVVVATLLVWAFRRPIEQVLDRRWELIAAGLLAASCAMIVLGRTHSLLPRVHQNASTADREILLITLDTTRSDHLSCYGYPRGTTPAIDRLARSGLLYSNAYSQIPLTAPSHATMFTGMSPAGHFVRNNGMVLPDKIPTFVESLADSGWTCAAFVSGIPLKGATSGLARGFHVYDDQFSELERFHPMMTSLALVRGANRVLPFDFVERRSSVTVASAIRWLEKSSGPRFLWVHLFDPHTPYDAPSVIRSRFARESAGWTASAKDVTGWPIADYDAEIRFVDQNLSRLLSAFEIATAGRGVVMLAADHGEGLGQHGELTHGQLLFEEDLRVPLIVSRDIEWPSHIGRTSHGFRELVEKGIDPRFFDLRLIPDWMRGTARLAPSVPALTGEGPFTMGWYAVTAATYAPEGREDKGAALEIIADNEVDVRTDEEIAMVKLGPEKQYTPRRKLIMNWNRGEEAAYDLWQDPGETRPLNTEASQYVSSWKDLRYRIPPPTTERVSIDPEVERRLKSLGYIH